ncbi:hypothetical protein Cgig2_008019 [Carnegiea gigantea]|uniref:Uncharacterized protein n=1 Tax=Carnegiea gigantea TaxID=171969 RepID=A0A9Q1QUW0_9CARY|nr:hypothetical protein Cgig2_008019 [Carnegiea gigantea]
MASGHTAPISLHEPAPLLKQKSWAPDSYREEAWLRQKERLSRRSRRSKSLTDEDMDELRACIELGFGFDSPNSSGPDQRLSDTFPALGFYYAVNKNYSDTVLRSSSSSSLTSSSESDFSLSSPVDSPLTMFPPGVVSLVCLPPGSTPMVEPIFATRFDRRHRRFKLPLGGFTAVV